MKTNNLVGFWGCWQLINIILYLTKIKIGEQCALELLITTIILLIILKIRDDI